MSPHSTAADDCPWCDEEAQGYVGVATYTVYAYEGAEPQCVCEECRDDLAAHKADIQPWCL